MLFLSCFCYASMRVCLLTPCGHMLGKGWPLGFRLWCLLWSCHFPIGILNQVWCLIVSIPDLCPLSYYGNNLYNILLEWYWKEYSIMWYRYLFTLLTVFCAHFLWYIFLQLLYVCILLIKCGKLAFKMCSYCKKQADMTMKYHTHKSQTSLWHREEETQNMVSHVTARTQLK